MAERVRARELTLGTFCDLGSAASAEIAAGTGFDWVVVDLEHGMADRAGTLESLRAINAEGCAGLVRVTSCDSDGIGWVLDAGAAGVVVPRAQGAADARLAVERSRYADARGASPSPRASGYGRQADYAGVADGQRLLIVQIETPGAVDEVAEIAQLTGVDVLFLGPGDLGRELGVSGAEHPAILSAAERIVQAAGQAGKAAGVYVHDPGLVERFRDLGFTFVASGFESSLAAEMYDARFAAMVAATGTHRAEP